MIINKFYLYSFYILSIILFFNYSSPFIFWVFTELNLLMFIVVVYLFMNYESKQEMFDLILFYFLIQSMASIFLLSDFFFSEDFFIFNSDFMFLISMLMKLGIFPFFYWIYKISNFLSFYSLTLILTLQKIPFFSFLFTSMNSMVLYILFFSFVTGSILIFYSMNFVFLMVSSSISSSFWIMYLFSFSFYFFLVYFFFYSLFIFSLLKNYLMDSKISFNFYFNLLLFMFLVGLSPFSLFFFKLNLINFIFYNAGMFEYLILWFFSFLSLFGYMKYSFKSFFNNEDFYIKSTLMGQKSLYFFFSLIFFFLFLI